MVIQNYNLIVFQSSANVVFRNIIGPCGSGTTWVWAKAINKLLLHHSLITSDYISIQMVKITKLVNKYPSVPLLNNPTSQPVMCFGWVTNSNMCRWHFNSTTKQNGKTPKWVFFHITHKRRKVLCSLCFEHFMVSLLWSIENSRRCPFYKNIEKRWAKSTLLFAEKSDCDRLIKHKLCQP